MSRVKMNLSIRVGGVDRIGVDRIYTVITRKVQDKNKYPNVF
jgi:hypothetical protein